MEIDISKIKFNMHGLVPAIVQEESGQVLMLAYMNEESLKKTIETGYTHFYSRSRQTLWKKGETSGNVQQVKALYYDCDGDALLVKVHQTGVACHTGTYYRTAARRFVARPLRTLLRHQRPSAAPRRRLLHQLPFQHGARQNFKESRRGSCRNDYRVEEQQR